MVSEDNILYRRNVAFLVKAIAAERERTGLPEKEAKPFFTNFIR